MANQQEHKPAGETNMDRAAEQPIDRTLETPEFVADNNQPDPIPARQEEPAPAPAPEKPKAPEIYVDPARAELAERAAARRREQRATFEPEDQFSVPPMAKHPNEPPPDGDDNQEIPEGAAQKAAPSDSGQLQPQGQTYTLKVRGETFQVNRDQLIAAAELDPGEEDLPDATIIKIAQKNIAATKHLEHAREISQRTKEWAAGQNSQPAQQPQPGQQPPADEGEQPKSLQDLHREYVEAIQFGEPDEATEKWEAFETARVAHERAQQQAQWQQQQQTQRLQSEIDQFQQANEDIWRNPVAADAFQPTAVREAVREIQRLAPQITDEIVQRDIYGSSNPVAAVNFVANAMREKGYAIAEPGEIMQRAANAIRASMNMPSPQQPAPSAQPPQNDRLDRKRALAPQPTTGTAAPAAPQRGPTNPNRNRSALIEMARARGQMLPPD